MQLGCAVLKLILGEELSNSAKGLSAKPFLKEHPARRGPRSKHSVLPVGIAPLRYLLARKIGMEGQEQAAKRTGLYWSSPLKAFASTPHEKPEFLPRLLRKGELSQQPVALSILPIYLTLMSRARGGDWDESTHRSLRSRRR